MSEKELRQVFGEALQDLGSKNEKVVVLDADLSGATRSELFGKQFPDRFINVGIAEANMVSIAAGLATCGLIPFATTFSFLLALRAADQIRSQICYPNLNVKLVGTNGGLSGYGDGATHQCTIDLSVMRSLPNMQVLVPSDELSVRWAVHAAAEIYGPVFIRIPRVSAKTIHDEDTVFTFGKCNQLRSGSDVTIVYTGIMGQAALSAAEKLSRMGIRADVLEAITLKPFDKDALIESAKKTGAVVTVEEHSMYGGLYSTIAEILGAEYPIPVGFVAIKDSFGQTGSYEQLLEEYGLTDDHIVEEAMKAIKAKK